MTHVDHYGTEFTFKGKKYKTLKEVWTVATQKKGSNIMSMNNSSTVNEKLISLIMFNLRVRQKANPVQVLRSTIFNQTIYPVLRDLPSNTVPKKQSDYRKNQAVAMRILRQILPYKLAKYFTKDTGNDGLYHAINDFKYRLNSDFYTLFKTTKG